MTRPSSDRPGSLVLSSPFSQLFLISHAFHPPPLISSPTLTAAWLSPCAKAMGNTASSDSDELAQQFPLLLEGVPLRDQVIIFSSESLLVPFPNSFSSNQINYSTHFSLAIFLHACTGNSGPSNQGDLHGYEATPCAASKISRPGVASWVCLVDLVLLFRPVGLSPENHLLLPTG